LAFAGSARFGPHWSLLPSKTRSGTAPDFAHADAVPDKVLNDMLWHPTRGDAQCRAWARSSSFGIGAGPVRGSDAAASQPATTPHNVMF